MTERKRRSESTGPRSLSGYSVVSQPLGTRRSVNTSMYALLFSEIVQYCLTRVKSTTDLERKLSDIGFRIGRRSLELVAIREKTWKRETRVVHILTFVMSRLWRFLFGKEGDSLKKVSGSEVAYYIEERDPLVNNFVSIPKDYGSMNCAAFVAGIISGVLHSSGFPAKVNVHSREISERSYPPLTIYYIEFDESVRLREKAMNTPR
eukprot:Plantae.Rhodophyta-Purpureofilum_apyrenoidigerum.ctg11642.p1 GENE.Plantae.Rhodophyta-Purpureofilum_apyrenoidigerum.ctg11642~~Plantae.Rhodophyta-Purpureofilum_apyrenoidigerum.ctg11642.p1  ORF type:complete len:206 (+),score=26.41 Plantae.Rhodophyta-Purpureofilum_apyrenoidigerum.ctg11642:108-725(+)